MKTIPLTRGKRAIVDDEDYERLSAWRWCAVARGSRGLWYAQRTERVGGKRRTISMHRDVFGALPAQLVDHQNGNGLDNRSQNLRLADKRRNSQNMRGKVGSKSGFKGVHPDKSAWMTCIKDNGKLHWVGRSRSKISAAITYNIEAMRRFGEFARPNDVFSGEVHL